MGECEGLEAFAQHEVRALFGNHDGGGIGVARGHRRHNRGICDPQSTDTMYTQLIVDHGHVVVTHLGRAAGMVADAAGLPDIVVDLVVRRYMRTGGDFATAIRRKSGLSQNIPRKSYCLARPLQISTRRKQVGVETDRLVWIGRTQPNTAAAFRASL